MAEDGEDLWNPDATARQHARIHLRRLLTALGTKNPAGALEVLDVLTESWGELSVSCSELKSLLTPDESPVEYSILSLGPHHRLRWVVHLKDGISAEEILELLTRLERSYGAQPERVRRLADLLRDRDGDKGHNYGIGVDWSDKPLFKFYSTTFRPSIISETLEAAQLGQHAQWLEEWLSPQEKLMGLAIDLLEGQRIKVYVDHNHCDAPRWEELGEKTKRYEPGEFTDFLTQVIQLPAERMTDFRVVSSLNLVEETSELERVACHLCFDPQLISATPERDLISDGAWGERITQAHERYGIDPQPYRKALQSFARVPLEGEHLIHSVLGYQRVEQGPAISVYLNPRMRAYTY